MYNRIIDFLRVIDRKILELLTQDSRLQSSTHQSKPFKFILGTVFTGMIILITYLFFLYYPGHSKYRPPSDYDKSQLLSEFGFVGRNVTNRAKFVGNVVERYKETYGDDFKERLKSDATKSYKAIYGDKYNEKLEQDFGTLRKKYGDGFINNLFSTKKRGE